MNFFFLIAGLRRWGNRKTLANKLLVAFSLIWLVALSHRLIWYSASNGQCRAQPGFYAYFDNFFDAIVTCLIPMITLTVLGILIGQSVRRIVQRRRIIPATTTNETTHANQSAIQKMDTQLTVMVFLEIFVAMISFLPYAAHLIYINVTDTWPKSPLRVAYETVIIETIRLLSYTFFTCPFYVSMIAISGFRRQLLVSLGLIKQQTHDHTQRQEGRNMAVTHKNKVNNHVQFTAWNWTIYDGEKNRKITTSWLLFLVSIEISENQKGFNHESTRETAFIVYQRVLTILIQNIIFPRL